VFKHLGPVFGGPAENLPPQCLSGSGLFLRGAGEVQKMEVAAVVCVFPTFFILFLCGLKTSCAQKTGKLFGGKGAVSMFWICLLMSQYILYIKHYISIHLLIHSWVHMYILSYYCMYSFISWRKAIACRILSIVRVKKFMCRRSLLDCFWVLLFQVFKVLQFPKFGRIDQPTRSSGKWNCPGTFYINHISLFQMDTLYSMPGRISFVSQQTTTSRNRSSSLFQRPVIVHSNLSWLGGGF